MGLAGERKRGKEAAFPLSRKEAASFPLPEAIASVGGGTEPGQVRFQLYNHLNIVYRLFGILSTWLGPGDRIFSEPFLASANQEQCTLPLNFRDHIDVCPIVSLVCQEVSPLCSQHPHYLSCSFFILLMRKQLKSSTPIPHPQPSPDIQNHPFAGDSLPCCRTIAEMHSCKSQTRNGSPVVAEFVVWIRRFNSK